MNDAWFGSFFPNNRKKKHQQQYLHEKDFSHLTLRV
jgi:hypothetical protein